MRDRLAAGPGWPQDPLGPADGLPLAGVRVLDLSRVLAGPFATMLLGDLGADVLKVERPGRGDDTRAWGPPFHGDDAAYFLSVNRNRRSLTMDLQTDEGAALIRALAGAADVVIENFLPRHLTALGLDAVRDAAPQAVWVSIRGAGSNGPSGALPGYDVMVQARGGLMGITGFPTTGPTKVGVAIADVVSGMYAAVSALAGLVARARTDGGGGAPGTGFEVPLLEAVVSVLVNQAANHLIGGLLPAPLGNAHPNIAPYGPVACADRALVVGAGNDAQFRALCDAIGREDLGQDPRYTTNADRVAHRGDLDAALAATLGADTADAWRVRLEAAGVPCAPVNAADEVFADEHIRAVGIVQHVDHPAGSLDLVASPLLIDGRRPAIRRAPPLLGADTDAVLGALGLTADEIADLRARGVC